MRINTAKRACIDYRRTSELSAGRKLKQHLFRILCANCVPDSEDTDIRRNGQSGSRPISHFSFDQSKYQR